MSSLAFLVGLATALIRAACPAGCDSREGGRDAPGAPPPDGSPGGGGRAPSPLPLYVESQIHHAFHESQAAEQAARMMAMDNATKNAKELIDDLVIQLNKIRQAGITKELLEIMTAVEALSQKG